MRIAVGGIAQETNTFFDRPSTAEHVVYARGPDLLGPEDRQALLAAGHEVVPLLRASVYGAGPITAASPPDFAPDAAARAPFASPPGVPLARAPVSDKYPPVSSGACASTCETAWHRAP